VGVDAGGRGELGVGVLDEGFDGLWREHAAEVARALVGFASEQELHVGGRQAAVFEIVVGGAVGLGHGYSFVCGVNRRRRASET
jgi:hypothetical protein